MALVPAGALQVTCRAVDAPARNTVSAAVRPPMEVVLPRTYYVLLVAEAALLTTLYLRRTIAAGDPLGHAIGWAGTISMWVISAGAPRRIGGPQ